jgi:Ca2+-binding RTX toxin-like protein
MSVLCCRCNEARRTGPLFVASVATPLIRLNLARFAVVGLVAAAAVRPAVAFGATAEVAASNETPGYGSPAVIYTASAGEANNVTVSSETDGLSIVDTGATILAGTGCTSISDHEARCRSRNVEAVIVRLGDGDDFVSLWEQYLQLSFVRAGNGDDVVQGGFAFVEELYGGPGADTLRGGPEPDYLDGGPGADTISGGTSALCHAGTCRVHFDEVSYAARANSVRVDPDGVADDGERGERDNVLPDVEVTTGGAGDDVLTGTDRASRLRGGRGDDVLNGKGGPDALAGEAGNDTVSGGLGRDSLAGALGKDALRGGGGPDDAVGGPGNDWIAGGHGRDVLAGGRGGDMLFARDFEADTVRGGANGDLALVDEFLDDVRGVEDVFVPLEL